MDVFGFGLSIRERALACVAAFIAFTAFAQPAGAAIGTRALPVPSPSPSSTPTAPPPPIRLGNEARTIPPAPTAFVKITTPGDCQNHNGGSLCALVIDGPPSTTFVGWTGDPRAVRYTVYELDGLGRTSRAMVASPPGAYGAIVPTVTTLNNVTAKSCFVVTATVVGESPPSKELCPGAAPQAITFQAMHVAGFDTTLEVGPGCGGGLFGSFTGSTSVPVRVAPIVGFSSVVASCSHDSINDIYTGALFFDVSSIAGRNVVRATLHVQTTAEKKIGITGSMSCISSIANGSDPWWNETGPIVPGAPVLNYLQGASVDFNVSPLVRAWAEGLSGGGAANFGMVLSGSQQNINTVQNVCTDTFNAATLTAYVL